MKSMNHPRVQALILNVEGARDHSFTKTPSSWFLIFKYNINTIKQYTCQHHPSSSAINALMLSISFKPTFINFAHVVLNMLAASLIGSFHFLFIVCMCVRVCHYLFVCLCVFRFKKFRVKC